MGMTSVVKSVTAWLPKNSYNLIYRDDIGNVSTSKVERDTKKTVFQLTPRYLWKVKLKLDILYMEDGSISGFMGMMCHLITILQILVWIDTS